MANGTRLFQLSESLKECQEAILQQQTHNTSFQQQQHTHNTSFQQQLTDFSEMLRTLVATQTRPPPEGPPFADAPPYQLPFVPGRDERRLHAHDGHDRRDGHDDRRQDRDDRKAFDNEGWNHRDVQRFQFEDDHQDPNREDKLLQTHPLRLDFPLFDGENPSEWTYMVNQFIDYYQTPLYQHIRIASFHMEGEALIWFQDA